MVSSGPTKNKTSATIILLALIAGLMTNVKAQSNFGIGGATPVEKADIAGTIKIGAATNANYGTIRYSAGNGNEKWRVPFVVLK